MIRAAFVSWGWCVLWNASPAVAAEGIRLDASRAGIVIVARTDSSRIGLSDDLSLTWTIEGPAPIRATPPKSILHPDAAPFWRIKTIASATRAPLPDGRERWTQAFRLTPFDAGKDIPLKLSPFQLQVGTQSALGVEWPTTAAIEVTTSISSPENEYLRPITDPESLPAPSAQHGQSGSSGKWAFVIAAILAVFAILSYRHRRSATKKRVPGALEAMTELKAMPAMPSVAEARRCLPQLADILRRFLERQLQLPASRQSTQELSAQLHRIDSLSDREKLRELLMECDRYKFAADEPNDCGLVPYPEWHSWAIGFVAGFVPTNNGSRS